MRTRAGLRKSRTFGAALSLLLASVLAAAVSADATATEADVTATEAVRAPIDEPMTGNLPPCPGQMTTSTDPWGEVWAGNYHQGNQFAGGANFGLKNNCAYQNWQDPNDYSSYPRAVDAKAVPNTVSISSQPVTVTVQAEPLTMPGPYNTNAPECMPRSTRQGGCGTPTGEGSYYVGYRLANGAGQFVGKWTLAGADQPNPYFDMTRGSCPSNYAGQWSEEYEDIGIPCKWTVHFVTTAHGAPVLTSAMQVVLAVSLRSGTESANGYTGPKYSAGHVVVPMMFQPGASTALDLQTSASTVQSGTTLTLSAVAQGPAPGTPVNFYRRTGSSGWSHIGQALTNPSNQATLSVPVTTTATYRARVVSGGTETTTSPERTVIATRAVTLKAKQIDGRLFRFLAKIKPDDGAGKAQLQTLVKGDWKAAERGKTKKGKVSWEIKVPNGKSSWRLLTKQTSDYGESTSKTKSVNSAG